MVFLWKRIGFANGRDGIASRLATAVDSLDLADVMGQDWMP